MASEHARALGSVTADLTRTRQGGIVGLECVPACLTYNGQMHEDTKVVVRAIADLDQGLTGKIGKLAQSLNEFRDEVRGELREIKIAVRDIVRSLEMGNCPD